MPDYAREFYTNRAAKLKEDIDHIKRHLETEEDPAEKSRLMDLKANLLTERLNYLGAIDKDDLHPV